MSLRTRSAMMALALMAALSPTGRNPTEPARQDLPRKKPDPIKISKNQAKAARRAARARKGGH